MILPAHAQDAPLAPHVKSLQVSEVEFCDNPLSGSILQNQGDLQPPGWALSTARDVAGAICDEDVAWYLCQSRFFVSILFMIRLSMISSFQGTGSLVCSLRRLTPHHNICRTGRCCGEYTTTQTCMWIQTVFCVCMHNLTNLSAARQICEVVYSHTHTSTSLVRWFLLTCLMNCYWHMTEWETVDVCTSSRVAHQTHIWSQTNYRCTTMSYTYQTNWCTNKQVTFLLLNVLFIQTAKLVI